MSANNWLVDAYTRHQIFVERFAGGVWKRALPIFSELDKRLREAFDDAQKAAEAAGGSPAWAATLQADVRLALSAMSSDFRGILRDEMVGFGQYEAGFNERIMSTVVTTQLSGVSPEIARAIGENPVMRLVGNKSTEVQTIDSIVRKLAAGHADFVSREIRVGQLAGEPSHEIVKRVAAIVRNRTPAQAEAVVRTVTSATSAAAQSAFSSQNADIISGERWVSTLDRRTTIGCAALDGRIFQIGEGPSIPRHYRCRSRRVPQIRPEFALPGFGGTRASEAGPVGGGKTYGGWLRDQSADFQNEVLGVDRGKLFRTGRYPIGAFADDSGRVYTLKELYERESLILRR